MQKMPVISPVDVENRSSFNLVVGDTVRVTQRVQERVREGTDGRYRFQVFEGLVIARKHGTEAGATFTVRRTSSGIGVERVFPLYSPNIDKIEVVRRAKVRRAKLYFLRDKTVRGIRDKLRRMSAVSLATVSEEERIKEKEKNDAMESSQIEEVKEVSGGQDEPQAGESGESEVKDKDMSEPEPEAKIEEGTAQPSAQTEEVPAETAETEEDKKQEDVAADSSK